MTPAISRRRRRTRSTRADNHIVVTRKAAESGLSLGRRPFLSFVPNRAMRLPSSALDSEREGQTTSPSDSSAIIVGAGAYWGESRKYEEKWVALICRRGGCRHPGGAAGDG